MSDFPPIFVITLREDFYRQRETQKHFDALGLKPVWFYGLNGLLAGIEPIVPHAVDHQGLKHFIHSSRIGNAVSHVFALERGLSTDEPEFFVMEDDVVLCDNFREEWANVRATIPDDIDVVQLAVTASSDKPSKPINEFIEHRYYPFCTTCTWWRRSGAEFAVKVMRPFNSPVDIMFMQRVYPFIGHAITIEPMAWDHSQHGKNGKWPGIISHVDPEPDGV